MPKIIVSYRRSDTEAVTYRIAERLGERYGQDAIFVDIDKIPIGENFKTVIDQELRSADIVLAIIGRGWLGRRQDGTFRIHDEKDPVAIEIRSALQQKLPLIPVLVEGAQMPTEADLPPDLAVFVEINAGPVDQGRNYRQDMERLIRAIDARLEERRLAKKIREKAANGRLYLIGPVLLLGGVLLATPLFFWSSSGPPQPPLPSPAEKSQPDGGAAGKQAAPQPARPSGETSDVRQATNPVPSSAEPDEAAWQEALAAGTSEAIAQFLGRFPRTPRAQIAREVMADLSDYERAKSVGTLDALKGYLQAYPSGRKHAEAEEAIKKILEAELDQECGRYADQAVTQTAEARRQCGVLYGPRWLDQRIAHQQWCRNAAPDKRAEEISARHAEIAQCVVKKHDEETFARIAKASPETVYGLCEEYLKSFTRGAHVNECLAKMTAFDDQQWDIARGKVQSGQREKGTVPYERYVRLLPKGQHVAEAQAAITDIQTFEAAKKDGGAAAIQAYIDAFPAGRHSEEAKSILAERAEKASAQLKKDCAEFSQQAVSLAEANLRESCNLAGQTWTTTDAQAHVEWCMTAKPEDRQAAISGQKTLVSKCAENRREREAWARATGQNTIESFRRYLKDWGVNAEAARTHIMSLCQLHWPEAKKLGSWRELSAFMADGVCETAKFAAEAAAQRAALDEAAWKTAQASDTRRADTLVIKNAYRKYLAATGPLEFYSGDVATSLYMSEGKYSDQVNRILHDIENWEGADRTKTAESYQQYIDENPNGRFVAAAKRQKARFGGTVERD